MKHHVLLTISAFALLAACGPSGPAPGETRPATDTPLQEEEAAPPPASDTASPEAESPANGDAEPFETGEANLDVDAALGEPVTDGEWFEQPNWTGYGPPASEAVFMIRCGDYGMVQLTRMVDIDPSTPVRGAIAAGNTTEEGYWTGEDEAELPAAHFELYASAPVFEAMAEADKIAILVEGEQDLVIPGSPSITSRVESCRDTETP